MDEYTYINNISEQMHTHAHNSIILYIYFYNFLNMFNIKLMIQFAM